MKWMLLITLLTAIPIYSASSTTTTVARSSEERVIENPESLLDLCASYIVKNKRNPRLGITPWKKNCVPAELASLLEKFNWKEANYNNTENSYGLETICLNPNGKIICSAAKDNSIKVLLETGKILASLQGHTSKIRSANYDLLGSRICSASDDTTIKIWDTKTNQCLATLQGHTSFVRSASFSPDGTRICSASDDGTVKIWDTESNSCLATLAEHANAVRSANYNRDGTKICSASDDGTIKIWNSIDGSCLATLAGHGSAALQSLFSNNGKIICSIYQDGTVNIYNAETLEVLASKKLVTVTPEFTPSIAFCPNDSCIYYSVNNRLYILSVNTLKSIAQAEPSFNDIKAITVSPNGNKIYAVCKNELFSWSNVAFE